MDISCGNSQVAQESNKNSEISGIQDEKPDKITNHIVIAVAVLLVIALFGALTAVRYADSQYQRDLRNWEIQLGIIADIRAKAVEDWVDTQFSELQSIADNLSLRLYLTELNLRNEENSEIQDEKAQITFIRNYLIATAKRTGFTAQNTSEATVRANIPPANEAGIVLLDNNGKMVVSTPNMAAFDDNMRQFVQDSKKARPALRDIYKGSSGKPMIAFIAPIFAVQGGGDADQQMGVVVGVRYVEDSLYPLLNIPDSVEKTLETILVREDGGMVEYISPLQDGTAALERSLNLDSRDFDIRFALEKPEMFTSDKKDYASNPVLVTSRKISNTPWTLIHKINRKEAMAEADKRHASIISIGLLTVAAFMLIIVAAWRHGTSVKARRAADSYKQLAQKFESQERLLRLVTDSQPEAVFIIDKEGKYRFANQKVTENMEVNSEDVVGKTLASVLGPAKAAGYQHLATQVLKKNEPMEEVYKNKKDGETEKVIHAVHTPLSRVPRVLTGGDSTTGVLVVEQDITNAIKEREKHERLLDGLVNSLVTMVDRRDPNSARHSMRVAEVAQAIAHEMQLDEIQEETATIAGNLMNLGKIMLPISLLTKTEKLTTKEKEQVTKSILSSADFLEGLAFEGPVRDTIRQAQEHWDGSGPLGIKGEDILVTARVVAVANAFVAMVSPRAYRPGRSREEVTEILMKEIGKKYQRRVVVAFVNYLDNNKDAFNWDKEAA